MLIYEWNYNKNSNTLPSGNLQTFSSTLLWSQKFDDDIIFWKLLFIRLQNLFSILLSSLTPQEQNPPWTLPQAQMKNCMHLLLKYVPNSLYLFLQFVYTSKKMQNDHLSMLMLKYGILLYFYNLICLICFFVRLNYFFPFYAYILENKVVKLYSALQLTFASSYSISSAFFSSFPTIKLHGYLYMHSYLNSLFWVFYTDYNFSPLLSCGFYMNECN
jgi:hypothetical protein